MFGSEKENKNVAPFRSVGNVGRDGEYIGSKHLRRQQVSMNVAEQMIAVASGQAFVELANSFVKYIISPIAVSILNTAGTNRLSNINVGSIKVGSFIEAVLKFVIIAFIMYLLYIFFVL